MQCKFCLFFVALISLIIPLSVCAETIHLQLRWHNQFQFAGYYAALQQGYYKRVGLDVKIHAGSPDKIPIQQVLKGDAQYGVANSELILARLKGKPLVALAAICQHSPSVLLTRKEANILSPADLIGKKVMMINPDIDADFVAMFHNEGISLNTMQIIPSSFDIQDLIDGKVDAFNSYLSNEPFFLQQQNIKYTALQPRNYGVDFYSDFLFTSKQEIEQHPKRVKAFLNASIQGWHYALVHPQEIIQLLKDQYHVPKTREHLQFEADALRALILPDLVEIGHINPWRIKYMADAFIQAEMVENDTLLTDFIYSPDAAKEKLLNYLQIAIVSSIVISIIAAILYMAYCSIKRESQRCKHIADELQQRTEELALHNDILQKINQGIDLPVLLDGLTRQVEKLHSDMICTILLLDEQNKLRHGAAPSLPNFYNQAVDGLSIGDGIGSCGTAAYRGERFIVENIQQHPYWQPFRNLAKQAGIQACWSQPIKNNQGNVLGTFAIYHTEPARPKPNEIALIENYANLAQLAIEHTRASHALLESEQRLRFVLQGSGLGFWDWKIDSHQIKINTEQTESFYYDDKISNKTPPSWLGFIHADDINKVWQSIQKVLQGKQVTHQIEYRIFDEYGKLRWILDHANIVQRDENGKPTRMSGTHTDITERKLAEQQLRDSEQRLSICQYYGGIGTWEVDGIHNKRTWSEMTYNLLGIPLFSEPSDDRFFNLIYEDDKQQVFDTLKNHVQNGSKYDIEFRITRPIDQQLRWIRSVGRVDLFDNDNKPIRMRGIIQDITERKEAEDQIKQLAFYDPLTQLPNRRLLNERLQQGILLGQCNNKRLAVLMMDLDCFKAVNDSLGHAAGDELLQQVADRIKAQLHETDTASRLGGDEFVVLLNDIYHINDAERIAQSIIHQLSQPFIIRESVVTIGTSIGISFYPEHSDNPEILIDKADIALYQAKDQGRGCFCIAA